MSNTDVRTEIKAAGIKLWQIADCLGYTDSTFSRKLRKELSEEEKSKIRGVIDGLKAGWQNDSEDAFSRTGA